MAAASREGKVYATSCFPPAPPHEAAAQYGAERVVNAAIGCYAGDDDEQLACLPVVEELYRALPMRDFITYAPPLGLESYRQGPTRKPLKTVAPKATPMPSLRQAVPGPSMCHCRQLFWWVTSSLRRIGAEHAPMLCCRKSAAVSALFHD